MDPQPARRPSDESVARHPPVRSADPVSTSLAEASEALRLANLAARAGVVDVVELYEALGSVTTLVDRLPPIVLFTQRCALANGTAGLRDDSRRDPGERLVEFVGVLTLAHTALIGAARALGRGHAALSHVHRYPAHP
ncbi:hypothetical protein GCM10023201_02340 [Actinomycetospora corticicola]|uniref:Uncharacterized protein n=1 Tax=Actinomycetospora corticicola TaxID=663602 RepID=A0A7Y9J8J2_9PSEU|nr:hypothetical protein [Actinomycetospora corticicola]NYD39171.1 hypothetical protein [Actinomycetospora corticicola]